MNKTEKIEYLLNNRTESVEDIANEVKQKESWLIKSLNNNIFDETHLEMVRYFIRDNKSPIRPLNKTKLMIQFISSAFSYNRIRKQLRKINREEFGYSDYPIREDHKRLLSYILGDNRFLEDYYWNPVHLESLITEIDEKGEYRNRQILSDYWLEHIMNILRTAPKKLDKLTEDGIDSFYRQIDDICKDDTDVFNKSERMWSYASQISKEIKNVGINLTCDFLKESGFTDFVKMDVHMIRSMSNILQSKRCTDLSDFELFAVSQWVAEKIKITPFKLDKILYVHGVYRNKR